MNTTTSKVPTFDDVWAILMENAKQLAEMREQSRLDKIEYEKQQKIAQAKSDKEMKALRTELGKLGNRLGDFVQEMVRPAAVKLFQNRGLPVHQLIANMSYRDDNGQIMIETDLFVINGTVGVLVECKSHASIEDVNEHLERMEKFKQYFVQYQSIRLHGAIAAMVMPDEVARYAYRKGLFVMVQNGEMVDIRNDDKFDPKVW